MMSWMLKIVSRGRVAIIVNGERGYLGATEDILCLCYCLTFRL